MPKKTKKLGNSAHLTKKWNSLSDLKEYLERTKKETIIEFNGYSLTTNKGKYGLAFGELKFEGKK